MTRSNTLFYPRQNESSDGHIFFLKMGPYSDDTDNVLPIALAMACVFGWTFFTGRVSAQLDKRAIGPQSSSNLL